MVQYVQQRPHMFAIASRLRLPDIINDHVADPLRAVLLLEQGLRERAGRHFRKVLMVSKGKHLSLRA